VLGLPAKNPAWSPFALRPTTGPKVRWNLNWPPAGPPHARARAHPPGSSVEDWLALRQLEKILRQQKARHRSHPQRQGGNSRPLAAPARGVPVIIHHIHGPSFGPFQGWLANRIFTAAERYAAGFTTHFVCSAQAMTNSISRLNGRPEMYTRIFSGFPVEPFLNATNDLRFAGNSDSTKCHFASAKSPGVQTQRHADLLAAFQIILPANTAGAAAAGLATAHCGMKLKTRSAHRPSRQGHLHRLGAARRSAALCRHHDCLATCRREALSRALPQARPRANRLWYDFDGADEVCLEGKTGFLGPHRRHGHCALRCSSSPATRRCGNALAAGDNNSSAKILPVEQMVTTSTSLPETGRRCKND